jgi:predicted transcriptional regulator
MLTPLELDIMKAVWKRSPITVRDVQEAIRPVRRLAYTTVMTIMDRLYHKGFLDRELRARTHYYEPAVEYTAVRDEAVGNLVKSFFGSKEKLQEFLNGDEIRTQRELISPSSLDETLL